MTTTTTQTTKATTKATTKGAQKASAKPVNSAIAKAMADNEARKASAIKAQAQKAQKAEQAASEAASKATPAKQWQALFTSCLSGKLGPAIRNFYASAITYHASKGTRFPRQQKATADSSVLASAALAAKWLAQRANTMSPGDGTSLAIFDRLAVAQWPAGQIPKGAKASDIIGK